MKRTLQFAFISSFIAVVALAGVEASAGEPVITTEKRKGPDGKDQLYMFIDGIKVHETDESKQPQPPVVKPGRPSAGAAVGAAQRRGGGWGGAIGCGGVV